ncbi:prefoldin beta-like domain containing protein [Tieghemostelium lacteum]|uniref:Prefoldin beta-like domain containing protein n=1 Tax=Tieghemostelium lacteum TaxID=361077 RepID=A0A152A299_TIELA|nr:prefoldin beta-like domain containing protein [Tieghemostelium lacteum]|eukprot:KYR00346.1 prefoldin beta-like domain containing protein [Tieghemostelium lacteum]
MEVEVTDKKAFIEMREKLFTLNRNLSAVRQRIQITEKDKQRSAITIKELDNLPPQTRTYKAIGKMFLLKPSKELSDELKLEIKEDDETMQTLVVGISSFFFK